MPSDSWSSLFPNVPLWFFGLGLILGSFANACIYRWPREISVLRGRSRCPHCDSLIVWHDNIPVISWLWLRGRCRTCRGPISIRYPFVEIVSGGAFLAAAWWFDGPDALAAAAFLWSLIIVFWIDYDHSIIPNEITLSFTVIGVLAAGLFHISGADPLGNGMLDVSNIAIPNLPSLGPGSGMAASVARAGLGAIVGGGGLWIIRAVGSYAYGQEAMGLGDVKLLTYVGAWLGMTGAVYTLFAGSVIGALMSLILMARRRVGLKSAIPFGPFLAIGALFALAYGRFA